MVNFVEISKSCSKALLIVLNLFSVLVALITLGFALVDVKILKQYGQEQAGGCPTGDVIIVVASLVMVAVATVGCVGAVKDSIKMLYFYVGFVLIMVILEMLIAIYVSIQRYGLQFRVTEWIREDFYRNVTDSDMEEHLQTWDKLQTTYECCGLNNPDDYMALGRSIPISCCPRAYGARSEKARTLMYNSCIQTTAYYKDGCEEEILDMLQSDSDYLIGVAVIFFWLEASSILLAMWVSRHLRNSVQVYKHTVSY